MDADVLIMLDAAVVVDHARRAARDYPISSVAVDEVADRDDSEAIFGFIRKMIEVLARVVLPA